MTKVDVLNSIIGNGSKLSELDYKVLIEMFKSSYLTLDNVSETLGASLIDVTTSSKVLIAAGIVEDSIGLYLTTPEGDQLINDTMTKWIETERPELLEAKGNRTKREISESMDTLRDYAEKFLVEQGIEIKETKIDRSNYLIFFAQRIKGIGALEIKNKGEIRVVGRKASKDLIDQLVGIGMTYRETPAQTYFDMPSSESNINLLITAITH